MEGFKQGNIILKSIIVVIIIIALICVIIGTMKFAEQKNQEQALINEEKEYGDNSVDYNAENADLEEVAGNITFFSIKNCIQTYLDITNVKSSAYYGKDENENYTQIISDNEIKQKVYNLLSNKYITENKINIENVFNYIDESTEKLLFVPLKISVLRGQKSNKYVAYGFVVDLDYYKKKDMYIIVNQDESNKTFSIELINKNYSNMNEISIQNEDEEIKVNECNKYQNVQISDASLAQEYFNNYKRIMLGEPKLAYEYLNEEYKNKRFGSYEEFEKYVNNNREEIRIAGINKYTVNNKGEGTEYVCLDSKENYCLFREKNLREYEVFLDTYTIESDKFITAYNEGNNQRKVQLNIDKFIKMINNKDYRNAYKVLDDNFKSNYFKTEEDFKRYVQNNFLEYSNVEYEKYTEEGDIYIYQIVLSDKTSKSDKKIRINIIMKLKDGTDFVMSFGGTN